MVIKYCVWSKVENEKQIHLNNKISVIWLLFSCSGWTQTSIGCVTVDFSQLFRKALPCQLLHRFVMMSNSSGLCIWCFKRTLSLLILLKLLFGYWCPTYCKSNLLIHSKWELTRQSAYVLQFSFFSFVKQVGGCFVCYFLCSTHLPCSSIYLGTTAEGFKIWMQSTVPSTLTSVVQLTMSK